MVFGRSIATSLVSLMVSGCSGVCQQQYKLERNLINDNLKNQETVTTSSSDSLDDIVTAGKVYFYKATDNVSWTDLDAIAGGVQNNFLNAGIVINTEVTNKFPEKFAPLDLMIYVVNDDVFDGMRKKKIDGRWIDYEKPRTGAFRMGNSSRYNYHSKLKEKLKIPYTEEISLEHTGYIIPNRSIVEHRTYPLPENSAKKEMELEINITLATHEVAHGLTATHVCYSKDGVFERHSMIHFMGYRAAKIEQVFHSQNVDQMKMFISEIKSDVKYQQLDERRNLWLKYFRDDENECHIYIPIINTSTK